MTIEIFTDGGARGNPGPAAIGIVIKIQNPPKENLRFPTGQAKSKIQNLRIKNYSEYIGEATNNQAEYRALIFALKKIKQLIGKKTAEDSEIKCYLDSELVVKQLGGEYKILEKELQPLFIEVWNLKTDFKNVSLNYIPREKNKEADRLVQGELDRQTTSN